jgi:GT2 family glycosyltransferase
MNVAATHATGRYLLLLGSDTEVSADQARAMADYLEHRPKVGACSPREKNGNGKLWPLPPPLPTAGRLLAKAIGARRLLARRTQSAGEPQEWLSVSCVLVRQEVGRQVGYFDPGYPFYYEDADLCAKIRQAGYELHVVPDLTTIHRHGTSSHQVDRGQRLLWITEGFCRYMWKHHPPSAARRAIGMAALTALVEALLYLIATVLTLGLVRSVRQRARVSPRLLRLLFCSCLGPRGAIVRPPASTV